VVVFTSTTLPLRGQLDAGPRLPVVLFAFCQHFVSEQNPGSRSNRPALFAIRRYLCNALLGAHWLVNDWIDLVGGKGLPTATATTTRCD
jgi:hypothetical protein